MANVTVRKENGPEQRVQTAPVEWDPMRMMRSMLRWDPFREMTRLWPTEEQFGAGFSPAFEIKETKDAFLIKADMPGVKDNDVEVTLTGNRLSISGKRESEKEEKGETMYVYERSYGDFSRSFTLPAGIDAQALSASLDNGVLTISIGKKPEVQSKKIPIAGTKNKS